MLKRFLYLLALAFLLQMSAGVVSAYCMHETGKASQHFGHHQHKHQSANGGEDNATPVKKTAVHLDCAACSHGAIMLFSFSAEIAQPLLPAHQQIAQMPRRPTPYLGLPERPNWTIVA